MVLGTSTRFDIGENDRKYQFPIGGIIHDRLDKALDCVNLRNGYRRAAIYLPLSTFYWKLPSLTVYILSPNDRTQKIC